MKVAIVKSRIYKGGVTQVLASIIQVLNENGIVPDVVTLRSDVSESNIQKNYGQHIKFKLIKIAADFKMPYEWHFLYFNLVSRPFLKRYDLIIDSNNTSFLSQTKVKSLNYIHFPRKARVISEKESIHLPEGNNKKILKFSQDPFFIARFLYTFNKRTKRNESIICNSSYTAQVYAETYPDNNSGIQVIYPPVLLPQKRNIEKIPMSVVTLGRFSEEKRQLEQIEIAAQLPQFNFRILGFSGDGKYLRKCQKKIESGKIKNVTLFPDISFTQIEQLLAESAFFLHNVRNEPFGISTVQALAHGCLPIVHCSGGSKEIVQNEQLMFADSAECIQRFVSFQQKSNSEIASLAGNYNLKNYSRETFMQSFREIFSKNMQ